MTVHGNEDTLLTGSLMGFGKENCGAPVQIKNLLYQALDLVSAVEITDKPSNNVTEGSQ